MNFKNDNKSLVDRIHNSKKINAARSSSRTYASTIRRLGNEFGGGFKNDLEWIKQPSLLDKIRKYDSTLNVKRNLVNSGIIALKLVPDEKVSENFHRYLLESNKEVDDKNKSGELTEKQLKKTVSFEKVVKLRKH